MTAALHKGIDSIIVDTQAVFERERDDGREETLHRHNKDRTTERVGRERERLSERE